jgi:hypothetical protein
MYYSVTVVWVLVFKVILTISYGFNAIVLESPKRADAGIWGHWEDCPRGKYVSGLQLKINMDGNGELKGIKLYCTQPRNASGSHYMQSFVGKPGRWHERVFCEELGFATAFQLKVDPKKGANNFALFCPLGDSILYPPHYNSSWGQWTTKKNCPADHAICAIQTQVDQGDHSHHRKRGEYLV